MTYISVEEKNIFFIAGKGKKKITNYVEKRKKRGKKNPPEEQMLLHSKQDLVAKDFHIFTKNRRMKATIILVAREDKRIFKTSDAMYYYFTNKGKANMCDKRLNTGNS